MSTATLETGVRGQGSGVSDFEERLAEMKRVGEELARQKPKWTEFFREMLGAGGLVRRLFPTQEERLAYERSTTRLQIDGMLCRLREQALNDVVDEPTRVITVRLPASLHESLRTEAHDQHTSINKLCIRKLLKVLPPDAEASPTC